MNGPIAAILAVMISTAAVLGGADLTAIKEEAQSMEKEEALREEASKYLIAIDAGHQEHGNFGQEPIGPGASETKTKVAGGTRGTTTGVSEYQLTLDVSLKLRDILKARGYSVLMIRETNDVDITNSERAQMANEAGADAFVRIHANGSDSASANGAMTICQSPSNPYNSELYKDSRRLSDLVLDAYTEATGIRRERVWETDTMSGINWCAVPVTIIELGYMTNPDEDVKMQDPEFQDQMAEGIASGIEAFINEKKESEDVTVEGLVYLDEEEPEGAQTGGTNAESAALPEPGSGEDAASDGQEREEEDKKREEEETLRAKKEEKARRLRNALVSSTAAPACKAASDAVAIRKALDTSGGNILKRYRDEKLAVTGALMKELKGDLEEEIARLGGKWSIYLKRLDTEQEISIGGEEKMVAASLIKLFVAGELYHQAQEGLVDADSYAGTMYSMINVSDNGAANTLINKLGMDRINAFARENGYEQTQLNRRMLEYNGTENYTSARDCGVMLEKVVKGTYVSKEASDKILEALKAQQRRGKIPAGVPADTETANKTGELGTVDNDAAIIWSPTCTYILCIMSSGGSNRIGEIVHLSSMIYNAMN